jgi:hypothetical protein
VLFFVAVYSIFPGRVEALLGRAATDAAFALLAPLGGLALSVLVGNSVAFTLTWVAPLLALNAIATYLVRDPVGIVVSFLVIGFIALMLFSGRASNWWYRMVVTVMDVKRSGGR